MNYFQAVKLLDEVRDGHNHTYADITKALELVGDIDPDVCTDGVSWWRPGQKQGRRDYLVQRFVELEQDFPGITAMIHTKIRAMK